MSTLRNAMTKFRFVCATRETQQQFANTALGRSLALFPFPFIELRLFPSNATGLPKLYNIALRESWKEGYAKYLAKWGS
jgi:hypothetical protein